MSGKTHTIPDHVLDREVQGLNLSPGPLREQLGSELTLLAFLRHLG